MTLFDRICATYPDEISALRASFLSPIGRPLTLQKVIEFNLTFCDRLIRDGLTLEELAGVLNDTGFAASGHALGRKSLSSALMRARRRQADAKLESIKEASARETASAPLPSATVRDDPQSSAGILGPLPAFADDGPLPLPSAIVDSLPQLAAAGSRGPRTSAAGCITDADESCHPSWVAKKSDTLEAPQTSSHGHPSGSSERIPPPRAKDPDLARAAALLNNMKDNFDV